MSERLEPGTYSTSWVRDTFPDEVAAIEAEARRPALDVVRETVEKLPDFGGWAVSRKAVLAALDAAQETPAQQLNHAISEAIATTPPKKKRKP